MATKAASGADSAPQAPKNFVESVDRWIYVGTAVLFLACVLVGFIPDSLAKLDAVAAGERAPFPPVLHVHAVLMGAWLLLLVTQATLMATGRRQGHMTLGVAGMVLAPLLVIVGFVLVPAMRASAEAFAASAPPDLAARARQQMIVMSDIMLEQIRIGIVFAVLVFLALRARRRDPALHKRLLLLGTAAAMPAALDRISWLPSTVPASPLTMDIWPLIVIAPMFAWDVYRLGRIHRAYFVWLAVYLPPTAVLYALWGTQWWHDTAPRLLGYG